MHSMEKFILWGVIASPYQLKMQALLCQLSNDRTRVLDDSYITYIYSRNIAVGNAGRNRAGAGHPCRWRFALRGQNVEVISGDIR